MSEQKLFTATHDFWVLNVRVGFFSALKMSYKRTRLYLLRFDGGATGVLSGIDGKLVMFSSGVAKCQR